MTKTNIFLILLVCFSRLVVADDLLFDSAKRPMASEKTVIGTPTQTITIENKPPWCGTLSLNMTEQTICESSALCTLDEEMNIAYVTHRPSNQSAWLSERDGCGDDKECIKLAYQARLNQISGANEGTVTTLSQQSQSIATERPSWCSKAQTKVEKLICGTPSLASLDIKMNDHWTSQSPKWRKQNRADHKNNFTKKRNRCTTTQCLNDLYKWRLQSWGVSELKQVLSTQSTQLAQQPTTLQFSNNRVSGKKFIAAVHAALRKYPSVPDALVFALSAVAGQGDTSNIMEISQKTARANKCGDISTMETNMLCGVKILHGIIGQVGQNYTQIVSMYLTGNPIMDSNHPQYLTAYAVLAGIMTADLMMRDVP